MTDYYLYFKTPDVKGDSQDAENTESIEIMSFSFGSSMPVTDARSMGGSATKGKTSMQDLSFMKTIDNSSIILMKHCWVGTHFKEVEIKCYRANLDGRVEYLNILLENCVISNYSMGSSGENLPTETFSLNFGEITLKYTDTDKKTGKSNPSKKIAMYDVVTNTAS